jgi:HPt (histidine-containing phosphotransfer) domain-containing protein
VPGDVAPGAAQPRAEGDAEQTVLDRAVIEALRDFMGDGGDGLLRSMQTILRRDMPGMLDALRAAADAGDAQAVFLAAHGMKGAVANIGATGMAGVCREIEESMEAGEFGDLDRSIDQLERYAELVDVELTRLVDG